MFSFRFRATERRKVRDGVLVAGRKGRQEREGKRGRNREEERTIAAVQTGLASLPSHRVALWPPRRRVRSKKRREHGCYVIYGVVTRSRLVLMLRPGARSHNRSHSVCTGENYSNICRAESDIENSRDEQIVQASGRQARRKELSAYG